MQINKSYLTYCTNIHPGESWKEHFSAIRKHFPSIKKQISLNQPMGIGLRLSNTASLELLKDKNIENFKKWLIKENGYVFTMNGFPYGDFHQTRVKDNVHSPDWTTNERVEYTQRLFQILSKLLPENIDGGISTSPLSYRHWHTVEETKEVKKKSVENILKIVGQLVDIKQKTLKVLHLDIEPEPDGVLETGDEFIDWFDSYLLPIGVRYISEKFAVEKELAEIMLKEHVRLCYDVCHFAIGYEKHTEIINKLKQRGIKVGKIQISAALKVALPEKNTNRKKITEAFSNFNESTYLHQVVARKKDKSLIRYRDLPEALEDIENKDVCEWRSHFHVPIFLKEFGALCSTQSDIEEVFKIHNFKAVTNHLEVETYTWEVLPKELKLPIQESIIRELEWVKNQM